MFTRSTSQPVRYTKQAKIIPENLEYTIETNPPRYDAEARNQFNLPDLQESLATAETHPVQVAGQYNSVFDRYSQFSPPPLTETSLEKYEFHVEYENQTFAQKAGKFVNKTAKDLRKAVGIAATNSNGFISKPPATPTTILLLSILYHKSLTRKKLNQPLPPPPKIHKPGRKIPIPSNPTMTTQNFRMP